MADVADTTGGELADLADQATQLIAKLPGNVRRVRVASGGGEIEVEWAAPEAVPAAAAANGLTVSNGAANGVPVGAAAPLTPASASAAVSDADGGTGATQVLAPVVGVFYRSPSPEDPPFVEIGDTVEAGQQVGIIEAMKLMNPIQADVSGTVTAVHVESGVSVEFGQPLLDIAPLAS